MFLFLSLRTRHTCLPRFSRPSGFQERVKLLLWFSWFKAWRQGEPVIIRKKSNIRCIFFTAPLVCQRLASNVHRSNRDFCRLILTLHVNQSFKDSVSPDWPPLSRWLYCRTHAFLCSHCSWKSLVAKALPFHFLLVKRTWNLVCLVCLFSVPSPIRTDFYIKKSCKDNYKGPNPHPMAGIEQKWSFQRWVATLVPQVPLHKIQGFYTKTFQIP